MSDTQVILLSIILNNLLILRSNYNFRGSSLWIYAISERENIRATKKSHDPRFSMKGATGVAELPRSICLGGDTLTTSSNFNFS
jgi:hypothetical protein